MKPFEYITVQYYNAGCPSCDGETECGLKFFDDPEELRKILSDGFGTYYYRSVYDISGQPADHINIKYHNGFHKLLYITLEWGRLKWRYHDLGSGKMGWEEIE